MTKDLHHQAYFGTDGIRARMGTFPMTPHKIMTLAYVTGQILAIGHEHPKVVIGKDTRISGDLIEAALEAGFMAAGVDVYHLGPMPTPGIAYLTRTFHAQAGIVISASHNPYHDNGIKFFNHLGEKLSTEVEVAIEQQLQTDVEIKLAEPLGQIYHIDDACGRYVEFCKASAPYFLSLSGLKIVLDCANGATYQVAPKVLTELGAELTLIGCNPNGTNINDKVGSTSPEQLQQIVVAQQADLGIALDGDGDRVILVDQRGNLIDGDQILYILAMDLYRKGKLKQSGVVGTQMSNLGLELALKQHQIELIRTKVGDRHVMQALRERQWLIGGESSGHIIWLESTTTGDGIVAALQVLTVMQQVGCNVQELLKDLHLMPQCLINVRVNSRPSTATMDSLHQAIEATAKELEGQGRVLLRASGTEPLIRVMVEAQDAQIAEEYCKKIVDIVKDTIAN